LLEQGSQNVVEIVRPLLPPGVAADPHAYREAIWSIAYSIFFRVEIFFIMVLMVVAGPNLISRDLRFNALPLYFCRPLRRIDYFLGKLGVLATMVAAVAIAPAIVAYVLGVCFSLDLGIVRDTWRLLPASILYGLVIVASAGTLMLAMSSLSRRSLYVGIAWGGFWVVSASVAGVLDGIQRDTVGRPMWQEQEAKRQAGQRPNYNRIQEKIEAALAKTAPTDWRPLCSYTANLHRLGEALLNTDAAWVQIGKAMKAPQGAIQKFFGRQDAASSAAEDRRLADRMTPQYPWTWSAGVLAGLLGISVWTLSTRVKSLDRLK
jgi:ABC-2 type transport system permease protein